MEIIEIERNEQDFGFFTDRLMLSVASGDLMMWDVPYNNIEGDNVIRCLTLMVDEESQTIRDLILEL